MCCFILEINNFNKPMGEWCKHCSTFKRCDIYSTRPKECKDYKCGYLVLDDVFDEKWYPPKAKMIVSTEMDGHRFRVNVHPKYPNRWREEPYYSTLKSIAKSLDPGEAQLIICVGKKTTVILPNEEIYLGLIEEGQQVLTKCIATASGNKYSALAVPAGGTENFE